MNYKKILVTGGLGFIGSHTVVELINNNYEVIIIDDLSNSNLDVISGIKKITNKKINFIKLDLKNKKEVIDFFNKNHSHIDGIIHFAAYKYVGESVSDPIKYYENNLVSLINILSTIKELSLNMNFVFSSSCTVYGRTNNSPIKETEVIVKPESPYGNTKQICEEILKDFSKSYNNINVISLRYFNPIGAHPSGEIGELPIGKPQNLVPFITQSVIGLYPELIVFGNNYNTKDGTCIRDYIDVVDLAKAHVASLSYIQKENTNKNNYETFNLGSGVGFSVLEVIKTFEKINNIKVSFKFGDRRNGDVETIFSDTEKAGRLLKWSTRVPLENSLKNAWSWEKKIRNK